jgi:transposase-like protein
MRPRRFCSPEQRAAAVLQLATGSAASEVAAAYGVSPSTVTRWQRDAGVSNGGTHEIRLSGFTGLELRSESVT